jgi:predicted lipoprotein with Yx(FWY)xxD motif
MVRTLAITVAAAASVPLAACGGTARSDKAATTASAATRAAAPSAARTARPTVKVTRTAYGTALSDRRGFALYRFTHDHSAASTCSGACAVAWPPYIVATRPTVAGTGARSNLLGATRRHDGRLQVTYAGHPLYYYVGDSRRGEVLCQAATEFGGTWYVVAADGRVIH